MEGQQTEEKTAFGTDQAELTPRSEDEEEEITYFVVRIK